MINKIYQWLMAECVHRIGRKSDDFSSIVLSDDEKLWFENNKEDFKELEKLRLAAEEKTLKKKYKLKIWLPLIFIIILISLYWLGFEGLINFPIACAVAFGFFLEPQTDYVLNVKSKLYPKIVSLFGDFKYTTYHSQGLCKPSDTHNEISITEYDKIMNSMILPRHNDYHFETCFVSQSDDSQLSIGHLWLNEVKDPDNASLSAIFYKRFTGVAITFELGSKRFSGHTIVEKKASLVDKAVGDKRYGLLRSNMVDHEFGRDFNVYTTDQVEARYLVDLETIESLNNISDLFGGKWFKVAFYDSGRVLILIETSIGFMEPARLNVSAYDPRPYILIKREIEQIYSLIEHLKIK